VLIRKTTTLCYNGGLLTPYNSVLSEKLLVAQLTEKLDACRSSRKLIAVFTELVNGPVENQMMPAYYTCVYLTRVLPIYACVPHRVLPLLARAYIIYEFSFSACKLHPYNLTLVGFTVIILFDTKNKL
jgi:hypothetical protein